MDAIITSAANFLQDTRPYEGFYMIPKALQETAGDYAVRLYTCIQDAGTAILHASKKGAKVFKICKTTLLSMFKRKGKGRGSERTYAQALEELREAGYLYQIQVPSSEHGKWQWYYVILRKPDLTFRGVIRCTASLEISSVDGVRVDPKKYSLPQYVKDYIKAANSGEQPSDNTIDRKNVSKSSDLSDTQKNLISKIRHEKNDNIASLRRSFKDRLVSSEKAALTVVPKESHGVISAISKSLQSTAERNDNLKIDSKPVPIYDWLQLLDHSLTGTVLSSIVQSITNIGIENIRNFDNYVSAGAYRYIQSHRINISVYDELRETTVDRIQTVDIYISPYLVGNEEKTISEMIIRSLYRVVRREKIILRDGEQLSCENLMYAISDSLDIGVVLYVIHDVLNQGIKNIRNFDDYVAEQIYWCISNGISELDVTIFTE